MPCNYSIWYSISKRETEKKIYIQAVVFYDPFFSPSTPEIMLVSFGVHRWGLSNRAVGELVLMTDNALFKLFLNSSLDIYMLSILIGVEVY